MTKKVCKTCAGFKGCRDTKSSWFFLFVGLIATISIRLTNLFTGFGDFWPKLFWYIGVSGFLIYFLYKFRQDRALRASLMGMNLQERISGKIPLNEKDYEFLEIILCRLRSKKDTINYFFIFATSAISLIIGVWQDFIKG